MHSVLSAAAPGCPTLFSSIPALLPVKQPSSVIRWAYSLDIPLASMYRAKGWRFC